MAKRKTTKAPPPPTMGRPRNAARDEFGLTLQQRAFADHYLIEQNATRSYIAAGYTAKNDAVAASSASNLLRTQKVGAYIDSRLRAIRAKFQINQERVLQEVARIAYLDIGKLCDEHGKVKALNLMDEDTRRALASIEVEELETRGKPGPAGKPGAKEVRTLTRRVKAHDKVAALEKLMRYLQLYREAPLGGLFIQPPEGGGTAEVNVKVKYTAAESYRRMLGGS